MSQSREEAANVFGREAATPVIRSMYPSTSRGVMASEFARCHLAGQEWMLGRVLELLRSNEADAIDAAHPKGTHPREWAEWMEGELRTVERKERIFKRGLADEEMK